MAASEGRRCLCLDISWLEREFRERLADREPPGDYAAAFYGFTKRKRAAQ
jgi:hypothetical protein